ncbi:MULTISPECIES: hypothetical protein [unclassified Bradyrhizobium]
MQRVRQLLPLHLPRTLATAYAGRRVDIYDGPEWTEMDIDDLKASLEHGSTIEEAAGFLCRSCNVDDVARKAAELWLPVKLRR